MNTENKNINSGHRKRLREKFVFGSGRALFDYEKLELLLSYSIPRRDVKPLAKALMLHFGSFQNLMNASMEELTSVKGIGENSATLIMLVHELCCTYLEEKSLKKDFMLNPTDAVNFARMKIGGCSKEIYMVIFLNAQNQIISYECVQKGTINRTAIYSRELVECCLRHKAVSIVIVHNHPSGFAMPSTDDLSVTLKLTKALQLINVKLYDHIIVTAAEFYSMASHGEL